MSRLSASTIIAAPDRDPAAHRRGRRAKFLVATAVLVAAVVLGGCKQGAGERCQVNADCADGLTCSQAEPKICGGSDAEQIDAEVPPQQEAGIMDAAIDAPEDAPADAPEDAPDAPTP